MKTKKLPDILTIALARYFLNYQLSQQQHIGGSLRWEGNKPIETKEYAPGRPWNKEADLNYIDEVCGKLKWGFQACAGTFWLFPKNAKTYHLYIDQDKWPMAEVHPNKKKGQ